MELPPGPGSGSERASAGKHIVTAPGDCPSEARIIAKTAGRHPGQLCILPASRFQTLSPCSGSRRSTYHYEVHKSPTFISWTKQTSPIKVSCIRDTVIKQFYTQLQVHSITRTMNKHLIIVVIIIGLKYHVRSNEEIPYKQLRSSSGQVLVILCT
jgi:hypothetical protein